ncbi:MAG: crossover junction endodeoxyribonuclease RuvC [Anaerolineae bacterium]|nr:crossover junction endodeoxyribonuclease RuvC [Anaerolineae bacterium]
MGASRLALGLDPGLATTGYGLVASDGQRLISVAYGVLRTTADLTTVERLAKLHRQVGELVERYHPDTSAVEELFFSSNARTAMSVGQARGVILLALAEAGLTVAEYTPMQIKQAVTGYGGADKAQVQEMVRLLLNLQETPRPDDAADALAVSICHHHSARLAALVQRKSSDR